MTQAGLAARVKRFLLHDVGSVERLDVLLRVHRQAGRWWTAEGLAAELGMPADAVQAHLEHLAASNLLDVRIAESVIFCYKPAREDLSRLVEEVAGAHYRHRDAVVAVLSGRLGSAQLFAEAFQLRKGKKPDG